jgi:AraC-like DNA-binding protein
MMLFQDTQRAPIELKFLDDRTTPYKEVFHFHPGIEIFFIHEGVGQVIIEQQIYEIQAGSLLFFRPYQPHYQQMVISPTQMFTGSIFKYNPECFEEYLKPFPNLRKFHDYLLNSNHVLQVQKQLTPERLDHFIKDFALRFKSNPPHNDLERNAIFLISLFQMIRPLWEKYSEFSTHSSTTHPFIIKILKWIDKNYEQEFRLESLSQIVHLSPNHVSFLFQKTTGRTITDFLTIRRMKQATLLLQTTSLTVQEVGQRSGYPNFPYFCQVFKKNMGMTPAQFREKK